MEHLDPTPSCPSHFVLDQFFVGALPPDQQQQVQQHIETCAYCQKHIQQREAALAFVNQHPEWDAFAFATPTPQKKDSIFSFAFFKHSWQNINTWSMTWSMICVSVCVLLVSSWALMHPTSLPFYSSSQQRGWGTAKGHMPTWTMLFAHHHKKQSRPLQDRQVLHPNDLLQLAYQAPNTIYFVVASVNQNGNVSILIPSPHTVHASSLTQGQGAFPKQGAWELDQYLGPERFFVFFSERSFSTQRVKHALQRAYQHTAQISHLKEVKGPWLSRSWLIHKRQSPTRMPLP
ncbi:MAG: hypothetical protein AAGJ35_08220 [Myxococcota bacterium]